MIRVIGICFTVAAFVFLFWDGATVRPEMWRLLGFFPLIFVGFQLLTAPSNDGRYH